MSREVLRLLIADDEPLARDVAGLGAERTHAYAFASSVVGHPIGHEPLGKGPDRVTTDDHDSPRSHRGRTRVKTAGHRSGGPA